jgi:mono/diheme cytochrome c family protein
LRLALPVNRSFGIRIQLETKMFTLFKTLAIVMMFAGALFAGCRQPQEMADQPSHGPLEKSVFFKDGQASRQLPDGVVAHGAGGDRDAFFYTGKIDGKPLDAFPFAVTGDVLARGRERYDIYCSPCHDRLGSGRGMVVQRGYRQPRSFHADELRKAPAGQFFEHMTIGFGAMPSYAQQITPRDRWAIAAYIRALQLSRNAPIAELPEEDRRKLEDAK